jgi:hypothetical protein
MMTEFNHLIESFDFGASIGGSSEDLKMNNNVIQRSKRKVIFDVKAP